MPGPSQHARAGLGWRWSREGARNHAMTDHPPDLCRREDLFLDLGGCECLFIHGAVGGLCLLAVGAGYLENSPRPAQAGLDPDGDSIASEIVSMVSFYI